MILPIFVLALVAFFTYHFYWKRRGLPPGPLPLPIFGNIFELFKHEPGYEAFRNWRSQFGPVYTIWLGTHPSVVFADYETIKNTIVKDGDSYVDREIPEVYTDLLRGGNHGVIETSGQLWRDQRRFALRVLRDFGLGKKIMNERVLIECLLMIADLKKANGQPVKIQDHLDRAVGSIINNLLFGYRFDDDKLDEYRFIKGALSRHIRETSHPAMRIAISYPFLLYFPFFSHFKECIINNRDAVFGFLREQILKHKNEIDLDSAPEESTDFVEYFFREMHKKGGTEEARDSGFTATQLENVCYDLWVAGQETTSNTLAWGVLFLLHNPTVQEKLHRELNEKVGSERPVDISDKNDLHYMNAFVNEVQRCANLLPVNVNRRLVRDVTVNGFSLKSGTEILPQISTVLLDPLVFPEPEKFSPERFLDEEGKFRALPELVPFGAGKRVCLGEGLARMELFLFLANIVNQFKVEAEDPKNLPTTRKVFGGTMQPQPYRVCLSARF